MLRVGRSLWRISPTSGGFRGSRTFTKSWILPRPASLSQARSCASQAPTGVPYELYKSDGSAGKDQAPETADAVVIGGGVMGCSTLYHLAKFGLSNSVLLEKDQLTAGTTWHTAGMVWGLRPTDLEVEILLEAKRLMSTLEEETGVNTGWINNGGLFTASTKERMDEYKRLMTLGKAFGVESHVLSPAETKKLYPLMNVDDLYASLYSPSDGTIDPAGYCTALSRGATRQGAKVLQNCSVTGIQTYMDDFGTKRIKAVETDKGIIKTDTVVVAAGVWSPYLGKMAGVKIPLIAMRHAYVVTERIEGIQNMPNCRDHDASVYLKLQGDALSIGGYEPNPIFWEKVDKDFAFSLFELDWDVFGANIMGGMHRVPAVETTGIKSTVCGPESFTPDHKPLLGESPEVRGFFLACGMNSGGMMNSPLGGQVAKWIVDGKPEWDLFSYDIRRFSNSHTDNKVWIKEKSHEMYAKLYDIAFPNDEPMAYRNLRQDALYQELLSEGCVYQERDGWERPGWFSDKGSAQPMPYDYYGYYGHEKNENNTYYDRVKMEYTFDFPGTHDIIGAECRACREGVAVYNMSYFGKYYLVGPDAKKAVEWIFTNNMDKPAGSTVYTCMCNKDGGTELDLTVSVLEPGTGKPHSPKFQGDGYYLAIGGAAAQHGYSYLLNVIQDQRLRCHLLDHSEDMVLISVQGPKSREVLQSLTDQDLSNEAFPFSTHKVMKIAGTEVRAMRLSFVGELGWEIHAPNSGAVTIHRALMEAGKQHGIVNSGYRAIDSLSIEKGYRHWHADLRADDTPLEAMLGFTCKLDTDTPFCGREALEKQKAEGIHKRLVCFTTDEHTPLHGLETIFRNDVPVGFIRRASYAHTLGKSMGYGYVSHPDGHVVTPGFLKSGTYALEHLGNSIPANIHLRTPFDPKNKRVKGIYD